MENQETIKPPVLDVTPPLESHIFDDYEQAVFWVGKVAVPGCVTCPDEYLAQRQLRANVYIDECNFLPPTARQADGGESDASDAYATQYVVLENNDEGIRAVGALRIIEKTSHLLPAEEYFEEVTDEPLPDGTLEASRFIARHEDRTVQAMIAMGIVRAAMVQAFHQESPLYAVVEAPLARHFSKIGLPYKVLCSGKKIAEYNNTINQLLLFQPDNVFELVKDDYRYDLPITPYLDVALKTGAEGYYDKTMRNVARKGI